MTIEELEEQIKMEEMQYEIACEHPTETDQYYRALRKHADKIRGMKQKLIDLKNPKKMAEKIFADGLRFENPREGAPEWIKGKISINSDKFRAFLDQYTDERGWVNLDVKQGKSGALYVELNTWKKGQKSDQPAPEIEEGAYGGEKESPF